MALWIVATPIGTLGDLSPRAREVLSGADAIASEDTRTTRSLLSAVGIEAPPLVAVHAHNEDEVADRLAERARSETIALVTDAGTPGVSDPGARLVSAAHRLGVEIRSVPGPSALAAALAASGFPAAPSTFLGFLPRKGDPERAALELSGTVAMFEAANRISERVSKLAALAPDREACMCREISKKFEEILRRPLRELATDLAARAEIRGECVLVLGPGDPLLPEVPASVAEDAGIKEIASALASRWGVPKRDVYRELLQLEGRMAPRKD